MLNSQTEDNGYFPEDLIKKELLNRINSGKQSLEDHELIVYFPLPRRLMTKEQLFAKFNLYVFDQKNPNDVYLGSEKLQRDLHCDTKLLHLFRTFAMHNSSYHFIVLTPEANVDRVKRATEEYVSELMK